MRALGGLGGGNADGVGVDQPQVYAALTGLADDCLGPTGNVYGQGVEEVLVYDLDARILQGAREHAGVPMCAPRDRGESLRSVVDGVHRRRDSEQDLRGADVRGGLVSTDVLLTGLQRKPVRRPAVRVD